MCRSYEGRVSLRAQAKHFIALVYCRREYCQEASKAWEQYTRYSSSRWQRSYSYVRVKLNTSQTIATNAIMIVAHRILKYMYQNVCHYMKEAVYSAAS